MGCSPFLDPGKKFSPASSCAVMLESLILSDVGSYLMCIVLFDERSSTDVDLFLTFFCLSGCRPRNSEFAAFWSDEAPVASSLFLFAFTLAIVPPCTICNFFEYEPFNDHCL